MSRSRPSRPCVIHQHQIANARERRQAKAPLHNRDYEADLSVDGDSGRVVKFQAVNDAAALEYARGQKLGDELVFEVRLVERGKYVRTVYDIYCTSMW